MSETSGIDAATRRLSMALDQLQALGTDRSRLAADLDTVTARSRRLEASNREVARRLDGAMETIRSVLNGDRPDPDNA
jgi:ABC-type transporter Mla subunit MlaD